MPTKPSPLLSMNNRAKDLLRGFIPAHRRFLRSGKEFFEEGEREVHALPGLVEKGTIVVDVGAHIGSYTYCLCKLLGPDGHVVAIEPLPDLAKMLTSAVERLKLPVTVYNCALSSRDGEADLQVPVVNGGRAAGFATLESRSFDHGKSYHVKLRRLDDICREHPGRLSFIKIDVEGHELEVLRGGIETLQRRPNLLIEIEQRHSTVPIGETFAFLESQGFRCEFLDANSQPHPFAEFDVKNHQDVTKVGTREYVSNFIFRPV